MPYYKIAYNKQQEVYYPRAVVQGKPVETETIAKDLAKISTSRNRYRPSASNLSLNGRRLRAGRIAVPSWTASSWNGFESLQKPRR